MLPGPTLDFDYLVVVLDDGSDGTLWSMMWAVSACNAQDGHVLDELPVPGCNGDGAMPLVRARDSWV